MAGPRCVRAAGLAVLAALVAGCRAPHADEARLRLAFFPNLTHAQALVGAADGTFARALGAAPVLRAFNAGPAAMEALLAGDVDVAYVGPGPAIIAYLRSGGDALRVVAGAASGGAQLVTRGARRPGDLAGARLASPQLGNTQDIALRVWLRVQGLREGDGRDRVRVFSLSNADVLGLFARGHLEGAWVPEPWGARLRARGGRVLVDERDLWPARRFPATVLVATRRALERRRHDVLSIVRAHVALTARWSAGPAAFARAANAELGRITGHPLEEPVLQDAFSYLDPISDPLEPQLRTTARRAQELGYAPGGDLSGLVDATLLEQAWADSRRQDGSPSAPP